MLLCSVRQKNQPQKSVHLQQLTTQPLTYHEPLTMEPINCSQSPFNSHLSQLSQSTGYFPTEPRVCVQSPAHRSSPQSSSRLGHISLQKKKKKSLPWEAEGSSQRIPRFRKPELCRVPSCAALPLLCSVLGCVLCVTCVAGSVLRSSVC